MTSRRVEVAVKWGENAFVEAEKKKMKAMQIIEEGMAWYASCRRVVGGGERNPKKIDPRVYPVRISFPPSSLSTFALFCFRRQNTEQANATSETMRGMIRSTL